MQGLGVGCWMVEAVAGVRHAAASAPFSVDPGSEVAGIGIALPPPTPSEFLVGRVLDPEGRPIPYSDVFVVPAALRSDRWARPLVVSCDARGEFRAAVEPDTDYDVTAPIEDRTWTQGRVLDARAGADALEVRHDRGALLELRVTGRQGRPVPRAGRRRSPSRGAPPPNSRRPRSSSTSAPRPCPSTARDARACRCPTSPTT